MKNIVLIGFMGTGKSTVASKLGAMFHMDILETDETIVERERMSIPEIFEAYGEQYFRDKETALLVEMQEKENMVISCGGGTPLRECNVIEMKKNGKVVWLTAKPETIWNRIKEDQNRPLLKGNMNISYIQNMMEARHEKYSFASDIIIETDGKSAHEICLEIKSKLGEEV